MLTTLTQANRPFRVLCPTIEAELVLRSFHGEEVVSAPGGFTLDVLSPSPSLTGSQVLRQPVGIAIDVPGAPPRFLHGMVRRFSHMDTHHGLSAYRVEITPWLWFLSLTRDYRIFQNETVFGILDIIFTEFGFHGDYDNRCIDQHLYEKREFCVMYGETYLQFVSRLLEDEGIFYFFEHEAGRHTLVLANAPSLVTDCPGGALVPMASTDMKEQPSHITLLQHQDQVIPGTVTYRDYNPLDPRLNLTSTEGSGAGEYFEYPGGQFSIEEGDRFAKLTLEEIESAYRRVYGAGTCRGFTAGHRFVLAGHASRELNTSWTLLQVAHTGHNGDMDSSDTTFDYHNNFVALPHATPYRPPSITPRPRVRGAQTAIVTGKQDEEIWPDSFGRVKVKFHWDRRAQLDENSSCWIRVAQQWAGKNWGSIAIPRIGQEVIVDFLEGDPDQPIIIGSVYNAVHMPPYDLPDNKTQSGIRSRSSRGATASNFNELRFEDQKGKEQVFLQAERSLRVRVKGSEGHSVGGGRSLSVGGKQSTKVKKDFEVEVAEGKYDIAVQEGRMWIDVPNAVCGVQAKEVWHYAAEGYIADVKGNRVEINDKEVKITAAVKITLTCGGSSIELSAAGIKITSSAPVEVKGTPIKLNTP
jgi:type VI secretion system secreted protein VgrG